MRGAIIVALYFLNTSHVGDESIPLSLHRLNESRMLWIIPQNVPYLANRGIDTVFRVYEDSFAPEPLFDLLPAYKPSLRRRQQHQQLHGNFLELLRLPPEAQLKPGIIQLKLLEFDQTWRQDSDPFLARSIALDLRGPQ